MTDVPLELLACPACRGPLKEVPSALRCERCGLDYPSRDGVVDFLPA
jgi:uncharacterized protein YbaR (Trm112 family)